MSGIFLKDILEYKRGLVKEKKAFFSSIKGKGKKCRSPHQFKQAISRPGRINLIAEIKKSSPSKGIIRADFDPVAIAKIYKAHGAAAISVLTEDKYFCGKPEFIKAVSAAVDILILTKDFIIDEGQVYEAASNGASAILLIAAILDEAALKGLMGVASSLDLDSLVEVHTEEELQRACSVGAEIIGINNRDLSTLAVDMSTCARLLRKVPKGKVIVAESGYKRYQEIQELENSGVHAVLIGETFMQEQNIGHKIKEVMYGQN